MNRVWFLLLIAALLLGIFFFGETVSPSASYIRLINAHRLHQEGLTGKGVTIAVIDEGFESHHPFFKNQLSHQGYNTDNHGISIGETITYKNGEFIFENHGTHITSILISSDSRFEGISKKSELIPIKLGVFHGDQALVRALDYVSRSPAKIVNLSLCLSLIEKAIGPNVKKAIFRLAEADKLIVVAAGNDGKSLEDSTYGRSLVEVATSPEVDGRMILVGAYEMSFLQGEKLASFSSFPGNFQGASVFITAPGVQIEAAFSDHKTGKLSGTSMAAPMVCGVAALLMEKFPQLSAKAIARLLLKGSRKFSKKGNFFPPPYWGQGVLDALTAYQYGLRLQAGDFRRLQGVSLGLSGNFREL